MYPTLVIIMVSKLMSTSEVILIGTIPSEGSTEYSNSHPPNREHLHAQALSTLHFATEARSVDHDFDVDIQSSAGDTNSTHDIVRSKEKTYIDVV
jgi:hypothetical protein